MPEKHALKAFENGIENVVSFLTEGITAQQLEQLSSLMDEKKIDTLSLFKPRQLRGFLFFYRASIPRYLGREELQQNIREAVTLLFEGEKPSALGFVQSSSILTSFELPAIVYGSKA